MIKTYSQNYRPYIYAAFPESEEETAMQILQSLSDDGVDLWFSEYYDRKEKRRLEGAFGVILFVTEEYSTDRQFHEIVDTAVSFNKNILCIYLGKVRMTPWMNMQLGSQLALFTDNYSSIELLIEKVKAAQIFQNMSITDAQKRFQRNRGIATVTIPIAAAAILFFAVIEPLLIEPIRAETNAVEQFGLSKADLKSIEEIHIVGNQSFDTEVHAWYENGKDYVVFNKSTENGEEQQDAIPVGSLTSDDLAILKEMPNLKILELEGQQITDLNILSGLEVESIILNCNPIQSLNGLENLKNLKSITLVDTYVSDITPLLSLKNLEHIQLDNCPVSDLSGIENLPNLKDLNIQNTQIKSIPQLGQNKIETLDVRQLHINDWSFISNVEKIDNLLLNNMGDSMRPQDVMPYLKGKTIKSIGWCGIYSLDDISDLNIEKGGCLGLANNFLTTLEGIEKFEGIESLLLFHHEGDPITFSDLTPILNLESLKYLTLSPDMQEMAEQQLKDAEFEIIYKWG